MTKTDKKKSVRKTETWRQSAMKLRFIVFGIIFVLLLLPHPTWARTTLKPKRVALISSSGVNNDFRSWGEYDGQLQALGWTFGKFRNTELEKFFERAQEYDLVLTTSLWNYGDPQDMRRYVPQWRRFLEQGGIIVLTDMAYSPMCDWLPDLREDLSVSYTDASVLGDDRALLDTSNLSGFLSRPNRFEALNYWAHFPTWGKGYSVWARTKAGTAIGLVASVGQGILIVTTAWAFSAEMLVNLYANARIAQSGVWGDFVDFPHEMTPGTRAVRLRIENLREQPITVLTTVKLARDQQQLITGQPVRLSLRGQESKTLLIPVRFGWRGKLKVVATVNVPGSEGIEVWRQVLVPDLVELKLRRAVLVRSDKLEVSIRLSPFHGRRAKATVTIRQNGKAPIIVSSLTSSKRIVLPAGTLKPGRYIVNATATSGMERQRVEASFDVSDKKSVPTVARIGKNGELQLNGKLFFPIGTYHVGREDLKRMRDLGFNCVTSPIYQGDQSELSAEQKAWHDEAHKQRLFVITELSEYIRAGRRNLNQARKVVAQLRTHPATIVHYAIDEPAGYGISPDLVSQFCQAIAEVDAEHPTFVNEVPGVVVRYAKTGNIIGTDPYPIGSSVPENLSTVGKAVRKTLEAAGGRPVWAVIQAHRQPPPHSPNRFPTPEEIRCMAYLALNNGAKGVLFYAWGDVYHTEQGEWVSGFKYSDSLLQFFPQFNRELEEIGVYYLRGVVRKDTVRFEPSDVGLDAAHVVHGKTEAVVVVNPTPKPVRASISAPGIRFQKEFSPFEVYVFKY
jgi:hypothetical protein